MLRAGDGQVARDGLNRRVKALSQLASVRHKMTPPIEEFHHG